MSRDDHLSMQQGLLSQELSDDPSAQEVRRWLSRRHADRRITPRTRLERDLGLDSMGWLHLALHIEQTTGIALSDAAVGRIETVGDLLRELAAAGDGRRAATFLDAPETHLSAKGRGWLAPLTPKQIGRARKLHRLNRAAMRTVFRLHVEAAETLPERQLVFAPTHGSYLDAFALAAALDFDVMMRTFWAADTGIAFGRPMLRRVSRLAQAFPFDADHGIIEGMTRAAAVLRRGDNLIWFPEGWLTRTGELQEFKRGLGMLLERYPVPVVPIAIGGAHEAYPPGARIPRPRPITIAFGDPLDPGALSDQGEGDTGETRITTALRRHTARLHDRTTRAARARHPT